MAIPALPDPNSRDWYSWAAGVDGAARQVPNRMFFRGAWATQTQYAAGDTVTYNNALYTAIADFTSTTTFMAGNWTLTGLLTQAAGASDATASVKGLVRLTNELGGSADAPVVGGRLASPAFDISYGNANDAVATGWYRGNNVTNSPGGSTDWHYYTVVRHDASYTAQEAQHYFSRNKFTRRKDNGTWSPWEQVAMTANNPRPAQDDRSGAVATTEWSQYNSGIRLYNFQQLLDLQTSPLRPPSGSLITVGPSSDYFTHYGSVWRVQPSGKFEPLNGVPIIVQDVTALSNLRSNYVNSWTSKLNFDHRRTSVMAQAPGVYGDNLRLEYRWDAGPGQFRLWPGSDTYSMLEYRGGTDQPLAGNTFTNFSQWDTWAFNGLNLQLNNPHIVIQDQGRYEVGFAAAVTNDDTSERFMLTVFNATQSLDEFVGFSGAFGDRPMQGTVSAYYNNADQIRLAIGRTNTGNQWIRRGEGGFYGYRPRIWFKYLGWR